MTTMYKLTDADGYTRRGESGETHWPVGGIARPTGEAVMGDDRRPRPCGAGVLHGYADPLLSVLLAPLHGVEKHTRLIRCEVEDEIDTDGLKIWTASAVRVLSEDALPSVTTAQIVRWAILVSLERRTDLPDVYTRWADRWLSGEDRSAASAAEAGAAAGSAADAARVAVWEARPATTSPWAALMAARASCAAAGSAADAAMVAVWEGRPAEAAAVRELAASAASWAAEAAAAWAAAAAVDLRAFSARLTDLARQAISEEGTE